MPLFFRRTQPRTYLKNKKQKTRMIRGKVYRYRRLILEYILGLLNSAKRSHQLLKDSTRVIFSLRRVPLRLRHRITQG